MNKVRKRLVITNGKQFLFFLVKYYFNYRACFSFPNLGEHVSTPSRKSGRISLRGEIMSAFTWNKQRLKTLSQTWTALTFSILNKSLIVVCTTVYLSLTLPQPLQVSWLENAACKFSVVTRVESKTKVLIISTFLLSEGRGEILSGKKADWDIQGVL